MLVIFTLLTLMLLAALAASLRSIYGEVAAKELNRRSHKGDRAAAALYQVARHGLTADILLLGMSIVPSAIAFIIIAERLPSVLALLVITGFIFLIVAALPRHPTGLSRKLAVRISPYFSKLLVKIRPATREASAFIRGHHPANEHTGLYEKEDLLELLRRQSVVAHNRIEAAELELAEHILTFGDKKVSDHMIAKQDAHFVHSEDPIGPVLLSELHDSGFSRFPVRNDEESIVGTLFLRDLVEKRVSGIVSNVMSPAVSYLNESAPLPQVLAAFIKTKQHLFVVVNRSEEVVGIITIEDVLEQMVGRKITGEKEPVEP